MSQIMNQNENEINIFIEDKEPLYTLIVLILKLYEKNLFLNYGKSNFNINNFYGKTGKSFTFSKNTSSSNYFTDNFSGTINLNKTTKHNIFYELKIKTLLHSQSLSNHFEANFTCDLKENINTSLKNLTRHFNKFNLSVNFLNFICDINYYNKKEDKTNNIIERFIILEDNISTNWFMPLILSNLNDNETSKKYITYNLLRDVPKYNKYAEVFEYCGIPTQKARSRFIELCEIIKDNKMIEKISINPLQFNKSISYNTHSKGIMCKLFNNIIFIENNLRKFNFLDHPGINLVIDFLDKTTLIDNFEAKISKEILTKV